MKIYKKITKRNSNKYFQDFLKKEDTSLKWFINFLKEKGIKEKEINYSPKSLILIWKEASKYIIKDYTQIINEDKINELPIWYYIHKDFIKGYTLISLKIIESLIYYFGEVFIKEYNLKWEIFNVQKPITEYTFKPVIMLNSWELYPFQQITTISVYTWHKELKNELSENNLYNLFNNLKKYIE